MLGLGFAPKPVPTATYVRIINYGSALNASRGGSDGIVEWIGNGSGYPANALVNDGVRGAQ